jgi:hypothetical protein
MPVDVTAQRGYHNDHQVILLADLFAGRSRTQRRCRVVALEVTVMSAFRRLPRLPVIHSFSFGVFATVVVLGLNSLINLATQTQWGDYLAIAYFALYGVACIENYLACREYHCLITGPGFLLAAVAMMLRDTGIFDHGFGVPYLIFGAAAVLGHTLEWHYRRRTGSKYRLV